MVSVIIAAHNEEAVIGRCLDALLAQHTTTPLQVIVSANGCTDRTAQVAAERDVTVIDRTEPGKPGALNAAERVAKSFPRVYLDADIVIPPGTIEQILAVLAGSPETLAVVPKRRINTSGRPWPVRAYSAINERLPVYRKGLFGRGLISLSETGRSRFGDFPPMIADDLFVDSVILDSEKAEVREVEVVVEAPYTTRDLLARLVRVRRGNTEMRAAAASGEIEVVVRPSDRWAWLREVVLPEPRLALAAIPYLALTLSAGLIARRSTAKGWNQRSQARARDLDGEGRTR